ncbi:cyclic nucleotide-binding domain protein (macronuclear) [Tetrahymena thermophila SB210]|uniref:Cyclic nucleotide-binding domain protein n=1 Tax=Tetrahymena thermophila (strain SB210) TaxID=312017 RepID=I7MJP3_TETTS|nr:cyclic nucleotide-binding domain protein [Tetrahymena thermophila SB210]EAS07056.2 cyclic nucleotide-binding domain protein [Tetrahymena thermophila SB210]|eukprot:XP_001027298.2 cyclic nucleotide-binding domain protein [Tetrahymena thermophila SB210]
MIISIFTMLFSCGVFAYSINAVGMIFNTLTKKSLDKKNNMYTISQYMDKKNVNIELQIQIKQYLEYYWDMQYSRDKEQEKNLINQLSPKLKEQLLLETFKVIVLECQIFKNNFSQQFVIDIIQLIEECSYRPDEIIVSESIQDDHSLYFIESGQVQVFIDEGAKKIRIANISNQQVMQIQAIQSQFVEDFHQDIDIYIQKYTYKEDDDNEFQENDDQDQMNQSAFMIFSQQDLASIEPENKHTGYQASYISQISFKKNKLSSSNFDEEQTKVSIKNLKSKINSTDDNQLSNLQGSNNNNINDQNNQKRKRSSILQIQPNLKIQCLIQPRSSIVYDQQQLENLSPKNKLNDNLNKSNAILNNYHTLRNSFDTKNSKDRVHLPAIKSDDQQGQTSDLVWKVQQLIEQQKSLKEKKEIDEEGSKYDIQKDYETYLPHNNLSYIIEYLKFKSRYLKQLKFQYKNLNQNIKSQLESSSIFNDSNNKENYMNQYPFNNPSCQRNFQLLRIFEKKFQQLIFRKRNSKRLHSQNQQIISNNQIIKNSLPNTKLQKILEQFQFAQKNQNQIDNVIQDTQNTPRINYNSQANKQIQQQSSLKFRNEEENGQEIRKSSFTNEYKYLISTQRQDSIIPNEQKSFLSNLIAQDQNMKHISSYRNYFERKQLFCQTQKYQNNPSKNDQIQTQKTQNNEISQIKCSDQDEIESPYSVKKNKINSSRKIAQKDKYFQGDFEVENPNKINSFNLNNIQEDWKLSKTYIEQQNKKLQNFQEAKKQKRYKIDQILF